MKCHYCLCIVSAVRIERYCSTLSEGGLSTVDKMKVYEKLGDAMSNMGVFQKALCYYQNMVRLTFMNLLSDSHN